MPFRKICRGNPGFSRDMLRQIYPESILTTPVRSMLMHYRGQNAFVLDIAFFVYSIYNFFYGIVIHISLLQRDCLNKDLNLKNFSDWILHSILRTDKSAALQFLATNAAAADFPE